MGRDVHEVSAAARSVYEAADRALGFGLTALCFDGPADELTRTDNAQPAIMATSLACLAAALEAGALTERPSAMAGHSLGEYTALVASGALSLDDGLRLVRERGRLMHEAGEINPGTLAAVVGLPLSVLEEICDASGAEVCNCNSAEQTVIGGRPDAVERAMALANERGAKRVAPLVVSGAFHSTLMSSAAEGLRPSIGAAAISRPAVPIIANGDAKPMRTAEEIRRELELQVDHRVLWQASVERLAADGVVSFIEIGPGKVLTGLIRRIAPEASTRNIGDAAALAEPSR